MNASQVSAAPSVQVDRTTAAPVDPRADSSMVMMSDGVGLATDVYGAQHDEPRPAVLIRLPYDKSGRYAFMPQLAERANERGYVLVAQDVRGKFRSEGQTLPCQPNEIDDAYDTLEWLSNQPWCDGSVVMTGDSYYGYTQWAATASQHPALKAIAPGVTTAEMHLTGRPAPGAVFMLGQAAYVSTVWVDNDMYDFDIDWSHRPLSEVFDPAFNEIGCRSAAFDSILSSWDSEEQRGAHWDPHPFAVNSVPVLHRVGWFDNVAPAHLRDYMRLSRDPRQAHLQYLIADAVDHENYHLHDVPIDPATGHDQDDAELARLIPRYLDPALDFFDCVLEGKELPERVRFMVGHDGWRSSEAWPPEDSVERRFHLAAVDGQSNAHALGQAADPERSVLTWTHDPSDLVPSSGGDPFAFVLEMPDENYLLERRDVLSFTSARMDGDLDIVGPATLSLLGTTTGPSMHVFAKLVDVAPDGTSHLVLRGQVEVAADDAPDGFEVSLGHTAYRLRKGHSLRLHVASSDFPRYMPHPGTDENPWLATDGASNRQTIVVGGVAAPALTLTVSGA